MVVTEKISHCIKISLAIIFPLYSRYLGRDQSQNVLRFCFFLLDFQKKIGLFLGYPQLLPRKALKF